MPTDVTLVNDIRLYLSTDGVTYSELVDMSTIGAAGSPERPDVDVTPLSGSDSFRQFRQGLATAGECQCMQHWNKTRHALLDGYFSNNTSLYWRVVLPDATLVANRSKIEFQGRLKKLTTSEHDDPDKKILIDFTIKLTGKPTFTPGAG